MVAALQGEVKHLDYENKIDTSAALEPLHRYDTTRPSPDANSKQEREKNWYANRESAHAVTEALGVLNGETRATSFKFAAEGPGIFQIAGGGINEVAAEAGAGARQIVDSSYTGLDSAVKESLITRLEASAKNAAVAAEGRELKGPQKPEQKGGEIERTPLKEAKEQQQGIEGSLPRWSFIRDTIGQQEGLKQTIDPQQLADQESLRLARSAAIANILARFAAGESLAELNASQNLQAAATKADRNPDQEALAARLWAAAIGGSHSTQRPEANLAATAHANSELALRRRQLGGTASPAPLTPDEREAHFSRLAERLRGEHT